MEATFSVVLKAMIDFVLWDIYFGIAVVIYQH